MAFGIDYNDDRVRARAILERVVNAHPLVLKDPAPLIRLNERADSAVNFIVRPLGQRRLITGRSPGR